MKTHPYQKLVFSGGALALFAAINLVGCSDSSSSSSAISSENYNGPGSKWDVSLRANNTFGITMRDTATSPVLLTVEGTYSRTVSGFTLLTVDSASGQDAPSQGDQAYALEVPGYAFMLRPLGASDDQLIPMIESGSCPTANINANWVMVKKSNTASANDPAKDFFGSFQFDAGTSTATLPEKYALAGGFASLTANGFNAGSCDDGLMFVDDAQMYLTANGGGIVQTSVSDEDESNFIFALPKNAISNMSNLDGNYSGLLFDQGESNAGDRIQPVAVACSGGTCNGNIVVDIETGATSSDSVTINLSGGVDSPSAGLVTGTIGSGVLACMADVNAAGSGRTILSCVGQSPAVGEQDKMFNILLVSN